MPSSHALLSASASERWLNCPPSARLEATLPSETSIYAEEGTRAHELCEYKLRLMLSKAANDEEYILPPSFIPDEEMEEATDLYRDIVEEEFNAVKAVTPDATLVVEQKLDLSDYVPEGFGTSDAVIVGDDKLVVIDFKYGKGVPVSAIGNSQLRLYALGAYCALAPLYDFKTVKILVIQPRIDNISSEELSVDDLLAWGDEVIRPAASLAFSGDGEFKVGPHCRFCRASGICRAQAEVAFAVVDHEKVDPPLLSDDEIPSILDKLDDTESWIASIRKYAQERAIAGTKWKGYKLVEARTMRKITDQIAAVDRLEEAGFSVEEVTNTKLKGLSELEKLCTKKRFNEILGDLVVKPQGAPTLVKESDKRPEYNALEEAFKEEV